MARTWTLLSLLASCSACEGPQGGDSLSETRGETEFDDRIERRLVRGEVHRFSFSWVVESTAEEALLERMPAQGGLALEGELSVRVHERSDSETVLGVRFSRLDRHRLEVMGRDVLPDPSALLHREAILVVPHEGEARRVFFEPDAPAVFRRLMLGVLMHVDLHLPAPGARSRSIAPTGNGLAEFDYARAGENRVFERRIARYLRVDAAPDLAHDVRPQIQSEARLELGDDGVPSAIASAEILVLARDESGMRFGSRTQFELSRLSVDRESDERRPDLAEWIEADLHAAPDHDETARELARQFAEGLSFDDLVTVVKSAGRGLRPSPGFTARARGLLRGWPELTSGVAELFEEAPDHRTRAFVLDLLVSADTPEAQGVIAELLGRQPRPEQLPLLVQHLALIRTPTRDTSMLLLDLLEEARQQGDATMRRSVLYPTGAVARELAETEPELAELMLASIRRELQEARSAEDRAAAIGGLGNAGNGQDLPRIVAHAHDDDVDVRVEVVSALRSFADPEADDTLFSALSDTDRMVGAAALSVIEGYRADDVAVERLALQIIMAEHRSDLVGPMVSVLAKRGTELPAAHRALEALARRADDPRERLRIERILGRS